MRFSWAMRLCSALRSGVCALFRSYARRTSFLASTCSGVGSTRAFGFLAFGVAFRDVFTAGLFQLRGAPSRVAGFRQREGELEGMAYCPRKRGNLVDFLLPFCATGSIPAPAGPPPGLRLSDTASLDWYTRPLDVSVPHVGRLNQGKWHSLATTSAVLTTLRTPSAPCVGLRTSSSTA